MNISKYLMMADLSTDLIIRTFKKYMKLKNKIEAQDIQFIK